MDSSLSLASNGCCWRVEEVGPKHQAGCGPEPGRDQDYGKPSNGRNPVWLDFVGGLATPIDPLGAGPIPM